MSFIDPPRTIQVGDLVLAWMTRTNIKPILVTQDEVLNTRYGAFPHNSMVGMKYGTQMASTSKMGFIYLMSPSPELWSMSLSHRTQIVYTPDASYITQRLGLRPGSKIIESGTGSASFTHSLARTVSTKGHVYTYEFHEHRFHEAKKELSEHSLDNIVTITHRDVCNEGFSLDGIGEAGLQVDAVFLDLPSPWTAIPHAVGQMNRSHMTQICCFSPCMEQVVKTVQVLKKEGFQRIEMVEVSSKKWEGRQLMVKDISHAMERLRDVKKRRVEGLAKRKERIKLEKQGIATEKRPADDSDDSEHFGIKGYNPWGRGLRIKEGDERFDWRAVSRMETEIKTHTSYLTFAVLPPAL